MSDWTVFHGDCLEIMREMDYWTIDAIVTDPPYGLGFMGKDWDDLPPGDEWALVCYDVLKPGGYLLAFGGARTSHRMVSAIEDAGFEIKDSIPWLFGPNLPKVGALKPGHEPICVARKPGKGLLNISACALDSGRLPANVVIDEATALELDEQSGTRKSSGVYAGDGSRRSNGTKATDFIAPHRPGTMYKDTGGASRFYYCPRASKGERPTVNGITHPTVKPLNLMRWLVRLATPPGGVVLDPFAGSGTTIEAAILEGFDSIGIEKEAEYLPLIKYRVDRATA